MWWNHIAVVTGIILEAITTNTTEAITASPIEGIATSPTEAIAIHPIMGTPDGINGWYQGNSAGCVLWQILRLRMHCPFRCFDSSPGVIRLTPMRYIRLPPSPRQVEDFLFERAILKYVSLTMPPSQL